MLLQSAVLGLGAYLTIKGELTAGAIIACSVASARALAPVDLAIGNWKAFVAARMAYQRLRDTVVALAAADQPMKLPVPSKRLSVEKITVAVPGSGQIILSDVAFELEAGQALGIIGPSAGGKTTMVRALSGIWPVLRGSVRLDGADLTQWREEEIGQHIGYLPQEVSLMDATIEENICRFEPEPDYRKVVEAAQAAGVHEMIVRMPDGYRTQLGPQGAALSAGQRQRVALARALYGNPFVVIMDEPNSNLDGEGEAALTQAIEGISARGGITIVIAHRPSALVAVDLVAIVQNGRMVAFGKKQDIMTPATSTGSRICFRNRFSTTSKRKQGGRHDHRQGAQAKIAIAEIAIQERRLRRAGAREEENRTSRFPAVSDRMCRISEKLPAGEVGSARTAK